jgi:hypothetical protein
MARFMAAPQLGGTGRVADDLYLMAHNDTTGRPYIQPRAAGIGLAGALLTELMFAGRLSISSDGSLTARGGRAADWLADRVLDQIAGEREARPAGEWLLFLSRSAAADVAQRLGEAGYLTRVTRRLLRVERWVPSDPDCAFMPLTRARAALDPSRPVTDQAVALAGLAAACGLESRLLAYAPPRDHRGPQDVAVLLPYELRELIAQTQAAVDSAVLAQRL